MNLHRDHLLPSTVKTLIYNRPNIKIITGSVGVVKILINDCKVPKKNIIFLKSCKWYDIGYCKVKLDPLVHDCENYAIHIDKKGFKILYAVDTASLKNVIAKNYNIYFVEKNYTKEELDRRIKEKEEKGEYVYEYRVRRTHLSAEEVNSFLIEMMGSNSQFVYCHQHIEE